MQYKWLSHIFLLIALSAMYFPALAEDNQQSYQLIYHSDSTTKQQFSRKEVRSLFTLKSSLWPDGSPVQIVTVAPNNRHYRAFVENELRLFTYQIKRFWDRQIFSGSAKKPIVVDSFEEMISTVGQTKGAIGFLPKDYLKVNHNEQVIVSTIN